MAATDQEIKDAIAVFAPQYVDNARIDGLIPYATRMTNTECYGDRCADAVALRICHIIALDERNGGSETSSGDGTAGTLKSEKEGDLAKAYGNTISDNDTSGAWGTLPSTTYGQMLIEMAQGSFMTVRNRFSGNC